MIRGLVADWIQSFGRGMFVTGQFIQPAMGAAVSLPLMFGAVRLYIVAHRLRYPS